MRGSPTNGVTATWLARSQGEILSLSANEHLVGRTIQPYNTAIDAGSTKHLHTYIDVLQGLRRTSTTAVIVGDLSSRSSVRREGLEKSSGAFSALEDTARSLM